MLHVVPMHGIHGALVKVVRLIRKAVFTEINKVLEDLLLKPNHLTTSTSLS